MAVVDIRQGKVRLFDKAEPTVPGPTLLVPKEVAAPQGRLASRVQCVDSRGDQGCGHALAVPRRGHEQHIQAGSSPFAFDEERGTDELEPLRLWVHGRPRGCERPPAPVREVFPKILPRRTVDPFWLPVAIVDGVAEGSEVRPDQERLIARGDRANWARGLESARLHRDRSVD